MVLFRIAAAALACAASGGALAQPAAPAAARPSAEAIRAAEEALASLDEERLGRDRDYAGAIADHLLVVLGGPGIGEEVRFQLGAMRVLVLAAAARHDAAEAAADGLIRLRPGAAAAYNAALAAALEAGRHARVAAVLESAARGLSEPGERAEFIESFRREHVGWHLHQLRDDKDSQVRFADALLRLGWPGAGDSPGQADTLRMIVLERHLDRGDARAAQRLASEIGSVGAVLRLVTERRFDALIGEADRVARVRAAIEQEDRTTAAALAAAPDDVDALAERATLLRSLGRDRAALDLLLPLMGDPALVVQRGTRGLWLVNEAAYALISTGAEGEAIELMRPLVAMDLQERPELINTSINFTHMLLKAGRNQGVLREAERLDAAGAGIASDYGNMIVWGNAACAAADLGRRADSDRWVARMERKADENPGAIIQARLCRGESDQAERLLLAALESERWREHAVLWTHDWEPRPETAASQRLADRFAALRARPAVEAAFARIGRRLRLPLPSTTYGF